METVSFKKGDKIKCGDSVYEFVEYEECDLCRTGTCPGFIGTIPRSFGCGWFGGKSAYTLVERKEEKMKTTFEHKFKVGDKVRAVLSKLTGEISGLDYCALATESKVAYHIKNRLGETRTMVEYQLELVPEVTGEDVFDGVVRAFHEYYDGNGNYKDMVLYIKTSNWNKLCSYLRFSLASTVGNRFMDKKVFLVNDEDAPEWRWA